MRYCDDGKFINCEDCGRLIKIHSKDNQTTRCNKCYEEYRKNVINENAKRYYKIHN